MPYVPPGATSFSRLPTTVLESANLDVHAGTLGLKLVAIFTGGSAAPSASSVRGTKFISLHAWNAFRAKPGLS